MNIAALLAGFFSGIIGAMGLGGGAVLIIYLAVFTNTKQFLAQGINLIFFIPIGLLAVLIYAKQKKIKWKTTIPIALGGLLGAAGGMIVTGLLGGVLTSKIFGGLLVLLGLREIFCKNKKPTLERADKK